MYCRCGCGQVTRVHERSDAYWGYVRGEHKSCVDGHQNKKNPYIYIVEHTVYNNETECWDWTGSLFSQNGRARWGVGEPSNPKEVVAARAVYRLLKGPIPDGMFVCHTCDRPVCVNPDHLFLGTPRENSHDAVVKGRLSSGRRNRESQQVNVKLTVEKVVDILRSTQSNRELAEINGVSPSLVYMVRSGKVWRDVYEKVKGP